MQPLRPRALSLAFALIIMAVVMLIAAGMSASLLRALGRNKDLFLSEQAYYVARAAMEFGLADASANGIGYEGSGIDMGWDFNSDGTNDATGSYQIFSRAKPIDWSPDSSDACSAIDLCTIPIPGSGSAGTDCNFEDAEQSWVGYTTDPCNWNRISYGETTTIPFFYEDATYADGSADPADTGLSSFTLKVRTPDGQLLDDALSDDVVLNWQFTGECDEDGDGVYETSCYLTAQTSTTSGGGPFGGGGGTTESLIHESDVNSAISIDYEVLDETSDAITSNNEPFEVMSDFFAASDYNPHNLYVQLSVITPLFETTTTNQIPYLEYQIVVDQEISDNKILYTASGSVTGRISSYVRTLQASQSIETDSVVNFVIQN